MSRFHNFIYLIFFSLLLQFHWPPCAFIGMHPHTKTQCHRSFLQHGSQPSQFPAVVVAALLRNYNPHIIRGRTSKHPSWVLMQVRTFACALVCECCSFSQPFRRVLALPKWPCPFSFLASQSLYESFSLLTMLISAFKPALQSGCLLHLFVLCTLLSDRFCDLPAWALPHHSIMMSLWDSVWSSPPLKSSILSTQLSPLIILS